MIFVSNVYPPYFYIVYSLQLVSMVCLVISLFFMVMVVATESRKWKNVSHIGWINGILVVTIAIWNSSVFSINIIVGTDACGLFNVVKEKSDFGTLGGKLEQSLFPIVTECFFGQGDLASFFNVSEYVPSSPQLGQASGIFIEYS
jgi:hypothetical protein